MEIEKKINYYLIDKINNELKQDNSENKNGSDDGYEMIKMSQHSRMQLHCYTMEINYDENDIDEINDDNKTKSDNNKLKNKFNKKSMLHCVTAPLSTDMKKVNCF